MPALSPPRRALLVALLTPSLVRAQSWPDRPIRLVVPVAPGGSLDFLARPLARQLGNALGQPVVVENHAGAGGNIAFELVARARPDGHTLLHGWHSLTINPALFRQVGYDPLHDFAPIMQMVRTAQLLVVRQDLPAADLAELLALAKRQPLSLGTPGNGSIGHLAAALMQVRAGVALTHVPYRGGGPALQDLVAGHVDVVMVTLAAATEHVRAGRIRALAVTTANRAAALPAVPTLAESGFAGFEVASWQGLLAPAGTDPAIIARLNAEASRILREPALAAHLTDQGFELVLGSPEALAARLSDETPRWPDVVRLAGAKVD